MKTIFLLLITTLSFNAIAQSEGEKSSDDLGGDPFCLEKMSGHGGVIAYSTDILVSDGLLVVDFSNGRVIRQPIAEIDVDKKRVWEGLTRYEINRGYKPLYVLLQRSSSEKTLDLVHGMTDPANGETISCSVANIHRYCRTHQLMVICFRF